MTKKTAEEQALEDHIKNNFPPKRSFIYRRLRDGRPDEEMLVEAHRYHDTDAGALMFMQWEWRDKGLQGPGAYDHCLLMLAPGTWYDVREVTESMQLRPTSRN